MSSKGRSPLEWVADVITTTDATITNGRIGMLLDRDEVAEIRQVEVNVVPGALDDPADDATEFAFTMSIDPDVIASPVVDANQEDLEAFHSGFLRQAGLIGAAGATMQTNIGRRFPLNFHEAWPLVVGSDIGWVVIGDAVIACTFSARIYFTRRRAKANEKFNVLLSRR